MKCKSTCGKQENKNLIKLKLHCPHSAPEQKMKVIILAFLLIPLAAGTGSSVEQESFKLSNKARRLDSILGTGSLPVDYSYLSIVGADFEGNKEPSKTLVKTTPSAKSSKTGTLLTKTSAQTTPSAKSSKKQCDEGEFKGLGNSISATTTETLKIKLCEMKKAALVRLECEFVYDIMIKAFDKDTCGLFLECHNILFGKHPHNPYQAECEFATEFICAVGAENSHLVKEMCDPVLQVPP